MGYTPFKYNPWEMPAEERKATFVGRDALVGQLLAAVREQERRGTIQHYLLLGPRGIGKTTLLLMIRDVVREDPQLREKWLCVQLREEEFYVYTLRDLFFLTLEALAGDEHLPEAAAIRAQAEAEADDKRSLAIALAGLRRLCADHAKRLLLLIDNFDRVCPGDRMHDSVSRAFRKYLSTESWLMVIGASVKVFEDIAPYDQAFFNFFCPVYLRNLDDEDVCLLLRRRAERDENHVFVKDLEGIRAKIRAITSLTGGNPRLVLMLYDILSRGDLRPVVEALRETVDNLTPLLKDVLENLPRQQSKTLDALMRLGGVGSPSDIARLARLPLNAVTTQLGRLKEGRFVESEGGGKGHPATYRVSDQMFRAWYQMRYLRPAHRRIELLVEFLRAWYTVEERLRHRGVAKGLRGRHGEALEDFERALNTPSMSDEERGVAMLNRATSLRELGRRDEALAELHQCALLPGVQGAATIRMARLLLETDRLDEAAERVAQLSHIEPEGEPLEQRLEARIQIVVEAAMTVSIEAAQRLLDALLSNDPPELQARLSLLRPALELARLGDEQVLAKLPQDEQEAARRIAARLAVTDPGRRRAAGRGA